MTTFAGVVASPMMVTEPPMNGKLSVNPAKVPVRS
jgi:hypothetical protein